MDMKSVISSNIAALGHEGSILHVQFNSGAIYAYSNVPEATFQAILTAESIGSTFNKLVKSKPSEFPFKKIS